MLWICESFERAARTDMSRRSAAVPRRGHDETTPPLLVFAADLKLLLSLNDKRRKEKQ